MESAEHDAYPNRVISRASSWLGLRLGPALGQLFDRAWARALGFSGSSSAKPGPARLCPSLVRDIHSVTSDKQSRQSVMMKLN